MGSNPFQVSLSPDKQWTFTGGEQQRPELSTREPGQSGRSFPEKLVGGFDERPPGLLPRSDDVIESEVT